MFIGRSKGLYGLLKLIALMVQVFMFLALRGNMSIIVNIFSSEDGNKFEFKWNEKDVSV